MPPLRRTPQGNGRTDIGLFGQRRCGYKWIVQRIQRQCWQGDAVQIFPGRLAPAPNSGLATMTGTTDTGFGLLMTRQGEINTLTTKYRFDAIWGTLVAQPEMAGIELFSQT